MRKVILLFAAVLLASIGWSQTMVITLNDGSTVKYNMNNVKSIDFTSESSDNGNTDNNDGNKSIEQLLVGTWMYLDGSNDYGIWEKLIEEMKENPYLVWEKVTTKELWQFRSDGTAFEAKYKNSESKGEKFGVVKSNWSIQNNNEIHLIVVEGDYVGLSVNYLIQQIDNDKMVLSLWGVTLTMIRVPESNFESFIEYYGNK